MVVFRPIWTCAPTISLIRISSTDQSFYRTFPDYNPFSNFMFYKCLFIIMSIIKRKNYEIIYLGLAPKRTTCMSL